MRHGFMESMAEQLAEYRIATFRYQFPYMELGRNRPDPPAVLAATVRAAVAAASSEAPEMPLLAGGKSMGGRLTSVAQAEDPLPGVRGLAFFGFPLHAAGRPSADRGMHLSRINVPMLFLQGTRDKLGELSLLRPLCDSLGPGTTLHILEEADHSFHVPKRTGKSDADIRNELARTVSSWASSLR
jgi:predicted alpha/beta-hydrolase family hydrolase